MKMRKATKVCINIKALFDDVPYLAFGRIETDGIYYDLYNADGELACMDGEEVLIEQVGECLVTFRNDNGDGSIYFALTKKEAEVAIIG